LKGILEGNICGFYYLPDKEIKNKEKRTYILISNREQMKNATKKSKI